MIRILFLIDKLLPAGTQNNLLEIVKGLDRQKFQPYVITLSEPESGDLFSEYQKAGVSPYVLAVGKVYGFSGIGALFFLRRWMKEKKIDIVQTFFLKADLLGLFAGRLAGVRRIFTARRDEGFWRTGMQLKINQFLIRHVDGVLANSAAVMHAVIRDEQFPMEDIHVIPNGVRVPDALPAVENFRRELGIQPQEIVVGVVANMRHAIKGHVYLLEAMQQVLKQVPSTKLLLIGDGLLRPEFEHFAETLGIKKQVLFLGSRRDIPELLSVMDIACLPSISEGFSNALLEYMAYGKAVVACHVGGNPEIIREETGFLVPPRDPGALAKKIIFLIQHPEERKKMGLAGRERMLTQFSFQRMVKAYEKFYEESLVDSP